MNLAEEFGALYGRFLSQKDSITREIALEVQNHTDEAFKKEGYTRSTYTRWKEKKRKDGFKILHQTGTLSSSTHITSSRWPTVVVTNSTPYGDYHNEGNGHVPERHFLDSGPGKSPSLDKAIDAILHRRINNILHG